MAPDGDGTERDSYPAFINWLIKNTETDKATILMIYWKSEPRFKESTSFAEKIEPLYLSGFYKQANFSFDPKDDIGEDWTSSFPDSDKR